MMDEVWIGPDGRPTTDQSAAIAVEIHDDTTGMRTYALLDGAMPATPYGDVEDTDQIQGMAWDLWVNDGSGGLKPLDSLDEFWPAFELEDETGPDLVSQVCHILELPVWDVAPEKLQQEVYAWLRQQTSAQRKQEKTLRSPAAAGSIETPEDEAFPTGEKRANARVESEARIRRWEQSIEDMLTSFYDRQREVVLARLQGTKARRGTRHWKYSAREVPVEAKALNAETIVQPGRWADEIQGDAEKLMLRLFRTSAQDTTTALGSATSIGLDSPTVQDMVAEHVRRIMSSTEARSRQVMQVILDLDKTETDLEEIVKAVIGTYEQRQIWAATTARTETTGAVNGSSFIAAREAGVTTKQWLSSHDELVRFTHTSDGGGDGQQVPLLAPFIIGDAPLMYPGDPFGPPDQVINCVTGDAHVAGNVEAVARGWYDGPMLRLRTKTREVTVSPKHPVLTTTGWRFASELKPGDNLVAHKIDVESSADRVNIEQVPPTVEEVFAAFSDAASRTSMRPEFDGDERWFDGDVDVVSVAGVFRHGGNIDRLECIAKLERACADAQLTFLQRLSTGEQFALIDGSRTPCMLGGGGERSALNVTRVSHANEHASASITDTDAGFVQSCSDHVSRDSEISSDAELRFALCIARDHFISVNRVPTVGTWAAHLDPGVLEVPTDRRRRGVELLREFNSTDAARVEIDEIVDVDVVAFSGHVYDLQTVEGYLTLNGICSSNCRCTMLFEKPKSGADRDAALSADGVLPLLGDGIARVYDQLGLDTPDFFDTLDDTPATDALVSAMTALLNALRGHIRAVKRASSAEQAEQRSEALASAAEYRTSAVSLMTEIAGAQAAQALDDRLNQAESV